MGDPSQIMSDLVSLAVHGEIGVITVSNPPVNALSPGVPEGIQAALEQAGRDPAVRALVLIGGGSTFIAGADIRQLERMALGQAERGPGLHPLLQALEDSARPVVAAIHGTAFGGGLEVAMACHYRVAAASAQVGQPEVKLGLIPGAGGTQRLPRLAGVAKALEMCVQGAPVPAREAHAHGILDAVVEGDLLEGALAFARQKAAQPGPHPRTRDRNERLGDASGQASLFEGARQAARKAARGLLAPQKAIDAVEAATRLPFDQGLEREAELFRDCLFSDQARALVHAFFAERVAARIPDVPKTVKGPDIRRAGVVGAGTMGSGIAMAYANAGIPVALAEASPEALERGLATIRKAYASSVQKGRLTPAEAERRQALIQPASDFAALADVDIVVEAVFEEMDLKKQVFAELDRACRPGTILASNTSSLDIDEIASATRRPAQVIGHHFFAPPHVMRLLEIVRGKATAPEVIACSMALARRLAKVGVLVGNCRGFVGNRMYAHYQREAQFLVEEGARVQDVDAALVDFGMALGPLATGDLSGLDVGWRVRKAHKHLEPPGRRQPLVADRLCEMGRFGQKTGAGWYRYEPGDRTPRPDPEVERIVAEQVKAAGVPQRAIAAPEIVERTIYALVNEAARILEEGMALRAGDVDLVYLFGYGFPAHRGGPLWHADTVGLAAVHRRIAEFHQQHGEAWRPAPLLAALAAEGKTFAAFDRERSPA
jgi:3-hydroxyacyl-CoA dehydrogenase